MAQNAPARRWLFKISFLSLVLATSTINLPHTYASASLAEVDSGKRTPTIIHVASRAHPATEEDLDGSIHPFSPLTISRPASGLDVGARALTATAVTRIPECLSLTDSFRTVTAVPSIATSSRTLRVLTLHGGGVRGIMELRFLQQLEAEAGRPVSEMFHMVAGTSAGGIIAAALTMPASGDGTTPPRPRYTADYAFNYMRSHYPDLFKRRWKSCGGLFGPRYRSTPTEVLANEFFGDHTFEQSIVDTLITTYDLGASHPRFFKTWDPRERFYTRDVILSTTAAPTYFKPRHVFPVGHTAASHMGYVLSDGGTFANDPTECLLADAIKRYPDANEIEIVSLGTGITQTPTMYRDVRGAGLLTWGGQAIDVFMKGQAAKCHYLIDSLFPGTFRGHYSYWNPIIDPAHAHLDDTSERNINALILAQDNLIRSRRHEFTELVERLRTDKHVFTPLNTYAPRGF